MARSEPGGRELRLVIKAQSKGERRGWEGRRGGAGPEGDQERWGPAGERCLREEAGGHRAGGLGGGAASAPADPVCLSRLPHPVPACLSRLLCRAGSTMDCSCVSDLLFAPPALPALWTPGNWPGPPPSSPSPWAFPALPFCISFFPFHLPRAPSRVP